MKELTIEQKARAYDEAKLRMSAAYNSNRCTIGFMNEIFPELSESEDEKIRKALIDYFKENNAALAFKGISNECVITWLEKQGDTKETLCDKCRKEQPAHSCQDITELGRCAVEQVQNSVDKVEPKFKQGDIIKDKRTGSLFYVNSIEDFGYTLHYKNCTTNGCTLSFKYEDNYELIEQTSTWNEEDENNFKSIGHILSVVLGYPGFDELKIEHTKWFKSLKDRVQPQPKQEWSKEDEEMLRRCISATFDHGYLKECDWLKSFRASSQWKPSKEQLGALWDSIKHNLRLHPVLESLYQDLKKLREE